MTAAAPAPKPHLSGFCNPTLPRTDAYDPHQRCSGCDCRAPRCPCNPETAMPEYEIEPVPPEAENPMTPEDHVDWIAATADLLDETLRGYSPEDWRDAVRLLHALRKPIETLRRIDADVSRWLYLNGEHGLHQQIEGIPGQVNITRGRSKERWAAAEAAQAYVDRRMAELEGEIPDPQVVVGWVLEAAAIGYCRKTALRDAGLDVRDFYTSEPGNISVSIG